MSLVMRTLLPFGLPIVLILSVFFLARPRVPFLAKLPPWIFWVLVLGLLLIWAIVILWSWLAARRRAKAIEQGLLKQAQWGVENAAPARRGDLEEIRKSLLEAMATLNNSPQGKRALYDLPWYLVIGPPGIGKTTLIVNSGLNFPGLTAAKRMRGTGGTRQWDFWFSTDAILLDTAGRYALSEDRTEAESEWFGCLELLRKNRPKGPINGLILGYSAESLGQLDENQLVHEARELRQRLDEMMEKLHWSFPVYVLFTKCDLISGFVEFFSSLSPAERQQVWGTAYAVEGPAGQPVGDRFRAGFAALVRRLREYRIRRMGRLEQGDSWGRAFLFPEEFAALENRAHLFIETLFEVNPFKKDMPIFRGVYFSSGRQMGRPFDMIISQIQSMLGGSRVVAEVQPEKEDAFFVRDLFTKVLKGDRELIGKTDAARRKYHRFSFAASTGLLALSLLSSAWIVGSCVRLGGRMGATKNAVTALPAGGGAADADLLVRLDGIRVSARRGWQAFPLVVANSVRDSALSVYSRVSRNQVLVPIEQDIARDLATPFDLDADRVRRALTAELMLLDPDNAKEFGTPEELAAILADYGFTGNEAKAMGPLTGIVEEYLGSKQPLRSFESRRNDLVTGGRRLAETHRPDAMLDGLIAAASRGCKDLRLEDLSNNGRVLSAPESARIRAAFTKAGFEGCVSTSLKDLKSTLEKDRKMLTRIGVATSGPPPSTDQVFDLYTEEYPREWADFIEVVRLPAVNDCAEFEPLLKKLRQRNGSALIGLLESAAAAAKLDEKLSESVFPGRVRKINDAMEPLITFAVAEKDKPSPADEYADLLGDLYRDVQACAEDPAKETAKGALKDAQDWVDQFSDRERANAVATGMAALLYAPTNVSAGVLKGSFIDAVAKDAKGKFDAEAAEPVKERLANRYPFGGSPENPAVFDDVLSLLKPDGLIESAAAEARRSGQTLSGAMDSFLSRLSKVRTGVRMTGDELKSVMTWKRLSVTAVEGNDTGEANLSRVDQVDVIVSGAKQSFQSDGDEATIEWSSSATSTDCGIELKYTRKNQTVDALRFDSPWAIAELFDKGKTGGGGGATVVTWQLPESGLEVQFEVSMRGGAECPFVRGSSFRKLPGALPDNILSGP
ncbi:MAG: type VI secretion system membrane subunit TssM [Candidatus Eisenbacteria bacterium]|nr:type VI secretion system membrane subunit TssM [Candidatus Eisenbacteria bacterium]